MHMDNRRCAVVLATDVRLMRDALQCGLHGRSRYAVVGAANSAQETVQLVTTLKPHVVLAASNIARAAGFIAAITRTSPGTRTVAFAVANEEGEILACAEAGVSGYVLREAAVEDVIRSLDAALRGEVVCPPAIAACAFARIANLAADRRASKRLQLPDRQSQILALISEGLTNKEIASRLGIELSTVKNHIHALLINLGVRRRSQAVAKYRPTNSSTSIETRTLMLGQSSVLGRKI